MLPYIYDKNDNSINFKISKRLIFKRIPKASRLQACIAYTKVIQNVTFRNDTKSWEDLLNFASYAIGGSTRGGRKKKKQATILNNRIEAFMSGRPQEQPVKNDKKPPSLKTSFLQKLQLQISQEL